MKPKRLILKKLNPKTIHPGQKVLWRKRLVTLEVVNRVWSGDRVIGGGVYLTETSMADGPMCLLALCRCGRVPPLNSGALAAMEQK